MVTIRMEPALPKQIIHSDQTGFIKGRYIGQNIRLLSDVMEFTDVNKLGGILLFIDFEKAFDSIELTSIFRALELFNFGPNIRRWISRNGNRSEWRSPVLWKPAAFLPRKTLKKEKKCWTRPLQICLHAVSTTGCMLKFAQEVRTTLLGNTILPVPCTQLFAD